jgi:hypothetical protein
MATKDPAESFGEALAALLQIIFSLTFPLLLISLCGVSFLLALYLPTPEFGLWGVLAIWAIGYAKANTWAEIGLVVFALAALPLAWVAFREREARLSKAILEWVITAIVLGFTYWLRTVWPYDGNGWQIWVYGILLFAGWNGVVESSLSTLKIVAFHRANRPPRRPRWQQPHGARQRRGPPQPHGGRPPYGPGRPQRSADGPETI